MLILLDGDGAINIGFCFLTDKRNFINIKIVGESPEEGESTPDYK